MNFSDILSSGSGIPIGAAGVLLSIILYFFYLKNLSDLLKAIRLPNRRMKPAAVWLILLIAFNGLFKFLFYFLVYNHIEIFIGFIVFTYLISIFVVVWHFRMVRRIADSIEAEYDSRNIPIEHRPSSQTGTFMGVLMLLNEVHLIGTLGKLIALSFFIVMIAYWARTYKFKKEIQVMSSHQDEESLIFNDLN